MLCALCAPPFLRGKQSENSPGQNEYGHLFVKGKDLLTKKLTP
ncbi:MAG: hypothetical protein AVDCRST_MAG56-5690 [uncultured Cytophagales bacterium]|uniref:Uncharacterized protein n=1 Tax=uncultured Cytophagales bacterium TaxID=158755 RepID=A0A6J4KF14_9SPHI|nr:MAG: hypothetical protein AVDCRST_MAG56-5690 [uncultured Cytophagales bacterium]